MCDQPRDLSQKKGFSFTHTQGALEEAVWCLIDCKHLKVIIIPYKKSFLLMYFQMITREHSILKTFVLWAGDSSGESTGINAWGSVLEGLRARQAQTSPEQDKLSQALLTETRREKCNLCWEETNSRCPIPAPCSSMLLPRTSTPQPETLKASLSSPKTAAKAKPHSYTVEFAHTSSCRRGRAGLWAEKYWNIS